jgi:hypothetical protein
MKFLKIVTGVVCAVVLLSIVAATFFNIGYVLFMMLV